MEMNNPAHYWKLVNEKYYHVILVCHDYDNFSRVFRDYDFNIKKEKKPYLKKVIVKKDRRDTRRKRGRRW